uniref:Phosphate carrier protein, mitochondrial n=1 Tax=Caenorhabditis tropicalis TaxID=1561998 RepID=A0A1I7UVF7_9PELO
MGPFLDLMKNGFCSASPPPLTPSSPPSSSPSSSGLVPFGPPKFYVLCGMGGSICCGFTHLVITPLDIVKCRMQVDPVKYSGVLKGFKVAVAEDGVRGLARAWAPTTIGYSAQGFGKFGYYEVFKNVYGSMLSEENAYTYRSWVYLAAASSAEFFADFFLAPFEAVKVRMQTSSTAPKTMRECMPMIYKKKECTDFSRFPHETVK